MREIKFRAWDVVSGEWIDWNQADDQDKSMDDGFVFEIRSPDGKVIIEQYTGLKDRDGVEIFEGDIMTHPDFSPDEKLVVSFRDGAFYLGGWDCVRTDFTKGKVVGKVHENKDLLEG